MTRNQGDRMFGVLPIHKPAGITSRDAVNHIQRILRPRRIKLGHTGTLDPLATGVLLIVVGPATRLVEFAHEMEKAYRGRFRLDAHSPTLDSDSPWSPIDPPVVPDQEAWRNAAARFLGRIRQVPPAYSAVQTGGRRAYELARRGQTVDLPSRQVVIHALETIAFEYPHVTIDVTCSTGTYLRSLGDDIARSLGSRAIMEELTRTRIGPIDLDQCVALDLLSEPDDIHQHLLPPSVLIPHIPQVSIDADAARRIRQGQTVPDLALPAASATAGAQPAPPPRVAAFDSRGQLVAILRSDAAGGYRPERVFPTTAAAIQPSTTKTPHSPES
ncbi:MAG: tRNA pseudouridine(55) synthase TruB [Planctomycetota bacterium]|nr:MAG: tRNA pseudouridine(55) synthase TruB [Planctomycetota bacterium]